MPVCSNCGEDNSDRARFYLNCGGALTEVAHADRLERRMVSVLFADLAGFTSRSESLDVEDVEGFLALYLAVLRSEVVRTGGQVGEEAVVGDRRRGGVGLGLGGYWAACQQKCHRSTEYNRRST